MIQKLEKSQSSFLHSKANLIFLLAVLVILGILFGYVLGRNSVPTTLLSSIQTPSEDEITIRRSIKGIVTTIEDNAFAIQNNNGEYTILTNDDTVMLKGELEVNKEVLLTVFQTGQVNLAEKIRVL